VGEMGEIGVIWVIGDLGEGKGRKKEMKMAEMMTEEERMTSNLPKSGGFIRKLYTFCGIYNG